MNRKETVLVPEADDEPDENRMVRLLGQNLSPIQWELLDYFLANSPTSLERARRGLHSQIAKTTALYHISVLEKRGLVVMVRQSGREKLRALTSVGRKLASIGPLESSSPRGVSSASDVASSFSLDAWQDLFAGIYREANRARTEREAWLHLAEELGEFSKGHRNGSSTAIVENLADLFAWLCTFASQRNLRLDEVVWDKFPGVCGYCRRRERCTCIAESTPFFDPSKLDALRGVRTAKPATLDEWQEMFERIYGNVSKILTFDGILARFMEEIGEVARLMRRGDDAAMRSELADVFAWLMALATTAKRSSGGLPLSSVIWRTYPGVCKVCRLPRCACGASSRQALPRGSERLTIT